MVAGVSRTRVFTATWPAYVPATDLGAAAAAEGGREEHQPGPFCQVEIRRALLAGTLADAFSPDTTTDAGGDLVFLEQRLLLRSYNSVSLSDGGVYCLTLANCHGFAPISSSSREQNALPLWTGGNPETMGGRGGYRGPAETLSLFFLPLPHSIEFRVDSDQVALGNPVVGNFHLLPVAHVPQLQHAPLQATAPNFDTATIDEADRGESPEPLQTSLDVGLLRISQAADGIDQACKSDLGSDGLGRASPSRPSSTGCFVSGAVVGALLGILSAWLVVTKGLGKEPWKRLLNWFVGADGAKAGWGRVMVGARDETKLRTAGIHVIGDGEPSENGSSDSNVILDGNVPEPVGLPRSEEDWRALFDTLYEDHPAVDAAEARADTPLVPGATTGQVIVAASTDGVVRREKSPSFSVK